MREFKTAVEEVVREDENGEKPEEQYVEFTLDDRTLRAYPPTDGQLAFMMASMGRGQTKDQRFASMINIMMATLRDEDQEWFESKLLLRGTGRITADTLGEIFEFLSGEWFGHPTQSQSDSAPSPQSDGQN